MDKLLWFLFVSLLQLPAFAQKDTKVDPQEPYPCLVNNIGITPIYVSAELCVTSTTQLFSTIGNDDLVKDKRADELAFTFQRINYDDSWKLEVNPIMHNNKPVFGWFHVILTGEPSTAAIITIMGIHDSKEFWHAPAGQFYWTNTKEGDCAESPGKKEKFVPCHYAQDPLPLAGRMFVDHTPNSGGLQKRYDLNFRVIFPRCDTEPSGENYGIFFRANVIGMNKSSQNEIRFAQTKQVTFTERVKYNVAVDPFPPQDSGLICSNMLESNMPSWVGKVTPLKDNTDADRKIPRYGKERPCVYASCFTAHWWEGRCRADNSGNSEVNFPNICEQRPPGKGPDENGTLKDYSDYVARTEAATIVCEGSSNCSKFLVQRERYGEDVGTPIGKYIWGARKGHGILMSVASFLAYPLSAYFARYYKETYMKTRAVINLHVWHAAHICGSFIVLSFIISGTGVAIYGRLFYGHSTSLCGLLHRIFGWLGAVFFLMGMITSGFRIAPIPTRKIAIFVHFLTGVFYQASNWLSLFTCACIPGSPPGTEKTDKGETGSFALFWLLTIVWLVFEVVMNLLASLQIRSADTLSEFIPRRTHVFGLVYMPSLTPDSNKDLIGKERRSFLLFLYTLGNSIVTVLALILIIYPDVEGRYFGLMDLTHFSNGSNRFADNYDEYAEVDE